MNQYCKLVFLSLFISLIFIESCTTEDTIDPTDSRDAYIGTWSCAENSSLSGASTYDVRIRKDVSNSNQLLVDNFYLLGYSYSAVLSKSSSTLSLPSQSLSGNTIKGNGSIVSDIKINLSYTVDDGSGSAGIDNCSAVLTKK